MKKSLTVIELVELLTQPPCQSRYIMLIGPQGAGKSTIAKAVKEKGFKRLSYDRVAKRNPWMSEYWLKQTCEKWLDKHLAEKHNVVDDNPNISRKGRKQMIDKLLLSGYTDIHLLYLDIPLATCLQQNQQRQRQTPDWVIEKVWKQFNQDGLPLPGEAATVTRLSPTATEGIFDMESWQTEVSNFVPSNQNGWLIKIPEKIREWIRKLARNR